MQETKDVVLRIEGINKSFIATKAVVDVSLEFYKGEVRGLIGENGSGKSTLVSMIAGFQRSDSGTMTLNGKEHAPASMLDGKRAGICLLVQEMGTINGLTVAENIFLGKEDLFVKMGVVSKKKMNGEAQKVLEEVGAGYIKGSDRIDDLSFEERKLVEVAAAVHSRPQILILDETTTALSQHGRDMIYNLIETMRSEGRTVIFISHDLHEMMQTCDNVSVLRDGHLITTLTKDEITVDKMRQHMIGRDLSGHYYRADEASICEKDVVLRCEGITLGKVLRDVSFDLHRGEILGIGGLTECGMHELCKIAFGLIRPDKGSITMPVTGLTIKSPRDAIKGRIAFVPKNREQEGIMTQASVKDNIVLMSLDKLRKGPYISKKSERSLAEKGGEMLSIKMVNIHQPVATLSGGNKQKVVLAKWLANDSEIFILDCPTRGIDIGVKAAIYRLMEELKKQGKSMIMVSEEMPELMGMSDRIIVLKNGVITGELVRGEEFREEALIQMMI